MFVARRQFAFADGLEEIDMWVQLPSSSLIAENGTVVYPATIWHRKKLLVLEQYFAAVDGTIWSKRRGSLKPLSESKIRQVGLVVGGMQWNFFVHRVVASTFLTSIRHAGQNEVDHIDVDNPSSALENLRWATRKQNAANKSSTRAKGMAKRVRDLHSQKVQQLCPETGSMTAEFASATAAAKATGLRSVSNITKAIAKRRKTAGGFAWQFAPRGMTLEQFKNRGPEVIGGTLAEAPEVWFSSDLQVYNNDAIGKMYELLPAHGREYPVMNIGGKTRKVHIVVAVLRSGKYKSLKEYDEYCAMRLSDEGVTVVVRHDDDKNKKDWWNCTIGDAKENAQDALRNGCNAGKSAAQPVMIHLKPDATTEIWKYDGVHEAAFTSFAEAARAMKPYSDLKNPASAIGHSARTGGYFSLKNGKKAWAFAA
jgi:hypothetical protein